MMRVQLALGPDSLLRKGENIEKCKLKTQRVASY